MNTATSAAAREKTQEDVAMAHTVEILVDGAVVFRTNEPGQPYDAEKSVRSKDDAAPLFSGISAMKQEVFAVASLTGANVPIKTRWITVGLLDSNQVHPREVFADAITDRAASIIVAHNHPSGTLEPSPEDIALTQRLRKAGDLLGIRVLDHLIMTEKGYISMKEHGCSIW